MSEQLSDQPNNERYSAVVMNLLDDLEEGFVLDKRKFRIVFENETPESVRVRVERIDSMDDQKVDSVL